MECPICYNLLTNSCIGSCTHHYCLPCLVTWCEMGGHNCPICNLHIQEIRPDIEFNRLNCPDNPEVSILACNNKIEIDFGIEDHPGITLQNNCNFLNLGKRGPGVIISKIKEKDKCYMGGLRINDIILFLNNIPCVEHKQAIDIIDNCARYNKTIIFVLLKSRI